MSRTVVDDAVKRAEVRVKFLYRRQSYSRSIKRVPPLQRVVDALTTLDAAISEWQGQS